MPKYVLLFPTIFYLFPNILLHYLHILNEKILDILKEINNKAPKISQKIKGNNNNVVGTGTINVYRNPSTSPPLFTIFYHNITNLSLNVVNVLASGQL